MRSQRARERTLGSRWTKGHRYSPVIVAKCLAGTTCFAALQMCPALPICYCDLKRDESPVFTIVAPHGSCFENLIKTLNSYAQLLRSSRPVCDVNSCRALVQYLRLRISRNPWL